MDKWEYLTLRLDWVTSKKAFLPHYIDDKEIKNWESKKDTLTEVLNQLGAEGWELVTTYKELGSLIFKRPNR